MSPRYMASKDLICGGVLGERCVVHGAFDRSTFGCAVIVLNPALNRNPSASESKVYGKQGFNLWWSAR